jgi:hypothetical protein
MRKFLLVAALAASSFAVSVGSAQAALSEVQAQAVQGFFAQLNNCQPTGQASCATILASLRSYLQSTGAVSTADIAAFVKAGVSVAVQNDNVTLAALGEFATAFQAAGGAGCTFDNGSFSAGCV